MRYFFADTLKGEDYREITPEELQKEINNCYCGESYGFEVIILVKIEDGIMYYEKTEFEC